MLSIKKVFSYSTIGVRLGVRLGAQIHNIRQLTSADVRYESWHFLPPRKKLADSNTFNTISDQQLKGTKITRGPERIFMISFPLKHSHSEIQYSGPLSKTPIQLKKVPEISNFKIKKI
jgi:hypothetical protein